MFCANASAARGSNKLCGTPCSQACVPQHTQKGNLYAQAQNAQTKGHKGHRTSYSSMCLCHRLCDPLLHTTSYLHVCYTNMYATSMMHKACYTCTKHDAQSYLPQAQSMLHKHVCNKHDAMPTMPCKMPIYKKLSLCTSAPACLGIEEDH